MNEIEYMPKPKDALGNTISLGDWVIYQPYDGFRRKGLTYMCQRVDSMDYFLVEKEIKAKLWFGEDCNHALANTCYLIPREIQQSLKELEEGENTQNKMM